MTDKGHRVLEIDFYQEKTVSPRFLTSCHLTRSMIGQYYIGCKPLVSPNSSSLCNVRSDVFQRILS